MNAIFILQGKGPDKALCELFFDMTPPEEKRTKNSSRRYKKISRKNYFYYSYIYIELIYKIISFFYEVVNNLIKKKLLVDVLIWVTGHCNRAAVSRNRYGVEKTVDTHKILINAIKFYVCLQEI